MKVVHIVTEDGGGAGRAARRISGALSDQGEESQVLVLDRFSDDPNVSEIWSSSLQKFLFKLRRKPYRLKLRRYADERVFSESRLGLPLWKFQAVAEADVVHLHMVNLNVLSYRGVHELALRKPVVWTLHDMWPITAGCHYDGECGGFCTEGGSCPLLKDDEYFRRVKRDKQAGYRGVRIAFVGCSNWMTECARASVLLTEEQRRLVQTIPNPIDTELFFPEDRTACRKRLGLPEDKKLVLFGAMAADSDKRKGYALLKEALSYLDGSIYEAVVFGNETPGSAADLPLNAHWMGKIEDDSKLRELYSAADVFCAPSLQENLSNAVMESLACGTPVVAFQVGGMGDLIESGETGYLISAFDVAEYAAAIRKASMRPELGERAVHSVRMRFSEEQVAEKYLAVYQRELEERR